MNWISSWWKPETGNSQDVLETCFQWLQELSLQLDGRDEEVVDLFHYLAFCHKDAIISDPHRMREVQDLLLEFAAFHDLYLDEPFFQFCGVQLQDVIERKVDLQPTLTERAKVSGEDVFVSQCVYYVRIISQVTRKFQEVFLVQFLNFLAENTAHLTPSLRHIIRRKLVDFPVRLPWWLHNDPTFVT